jgi:ProP effector
MSRRRIKRLLRKYTQSPKYWLALTGGTPRIDLEGNLAGQVTAADEEDAKRKIAKEAKRTAAKTIEERRAAGQPGAEPVAKCAEQQNPSLDAETQQPVPAVPPRLGLAGLRAVAQARRARLVAAE